MDVQFSTAALIHFLEWRMAAPEVCLAPGIWLARLDGSRVGELYFSLVKRPEFRYELDGGDGFMYTAFFRLESPPVQVDSNSSDPASNVGRLCNFLTLLVGEPIHMVRVIRSFDRFATVHDTEILYLHTGPGEYREKFPELNEKVAQHLSIAWDVAESRWSKRTGKSRIANSLSFFNHAWRSEHPEHACLHLSIALETLFAPHSMGETTHQIAYNTAHFLGRTASARIDIYKSVKQFYNVRSALTHGGLPDPDKVADAYRNGFDICQRILREMVLSPELVDTFDDEHKRRDLLLSYQFGRVAASDSESNAV